jgi:hypothetical protein
MLRNTNAGLGWLSIVGAFLALGHIKAAVSEDGFQYFKNSEIDYWKENQVQGEKPSLPVVSSAKSASAFPWKKYLDPKNEEFFKEGDYTPPAPFMEIARNPSDDNIANWFKYLELKNALTHRLQERLEAYGAQHVSTTAFEQAVIPKAPVQPQVEVDAKRFRLRLYFDSKCPHCQKMMKTIGELSQLGFWIELRQVDSDLSIRSQIPFPVSSATPKELKQYQIEGVPLLLVGDLKRGTFFKIQGEQPTDAVLQAIRSEPNSTQGGQL